MLEDMGLYFITDSGLTKNGAVEDSRIAIDAGVKIIQYREKSLGEGKRLEEALEIARMCRNSGTIFIVNNDVEIASKVNADGVHLGQGDMPIEKAREVLGKKIIGLTVHNVGEAIDAQECGADYLGASPIFATTTKIDAGEAIGPGAITAIKSSVIIPLVAIGGIQLENLEEVMNAGADGVCMVSATVGHKDLAERVHKIREKINSLRGKK